MNSVPSIRIAADGIWYYNEMPIERPELIRLFYGVLNKQPDGYYLTTPVENLKIIVEDVPYSISGIEATREGIILLVNDGATIPLNKEHPIRIGSNGAFYVTVRNSIKGEPYEARFILSAHLALAGLLQEKSDGSYTVYSFGQYVSFVLPD